MSFWNTTEGALNNTNVTTEAEMGGGNMEPIPSNTELKAIITEASYDENESLGKFIKLRWDVIDGEYKKRVIFQKVKVFATDAKVRDKAMRMLAAIAMNAGGKLLEIDQPTDGDLQINLSNKPMIIRVQQWLMKAEETNDGVERSGNWVSAVSSGKAAPAAAPSSSGPGF